MLLTPISTIATPNVITLDQHKSIREAVQLMADHHIHDVIVTGGNDLRIITAKMVITFRLAELDFSSSLGGANLPRVICVSHACQLAEALVALRDSPTEHLCVIDDQKNLVGIVSYTDMISYLDPKSLAEERKIKDLLSLSDFSRVGSNDSLKMAMLKMHTAGHSAALIELKNKSLGIITQSDITRALQKNDDCDQPVTHFMSSPVITVQDNLSLQEALRISREKKLKRLVICNDSHEVVGVLHQKDLVALVYENLHDLLRRQEAMLQAANQTHEYEERWRAVLEGTMTGVWDWNAETNKVYFSPTWKSMLGYAEDEVGDTLDEWDSRIHPEDRESTYADLEKHFSGQTELYENTHRVRCKDGNYKWILDRGRVFSRDASGKPLRVIGTHTDVTEAYEQKRQLSVLAEQAPGVLYQYRLYPDGSSCFPYATDGMMDVYGYTPTQVLENANPVLERLHPDDLDRIRESIAHSAETLTVWETQYRYMHPTKGERWLEGRATPNLMPDSSIVWNGYIYDITEKKRQQLALEETRARFQLTMEATDTGLWYWNLITNEVKWSAQAYQQLGYQPDEFPMSLERFQQLMHPEDFDGMMSTVNQHVVQHQGFDVQFRLLNAAGDWVWIQGRGRVTSRNADGSASMMMGTHTNISRIKQVESELALAKAAADQANRAKSEFLANMSHEIRTPMNGIIGLSQPNPEEQNLDVLQDRLRKINQSGRLLLGIINDILDFSKIEAGKMEIDSKPFFLRSLFDNLKSLFAQMASDKGLALNIAISPDLDKAYMGDELRLRQILTNLVGNAIKFTRRGSVNLEVTRLDTTGTIERLHFTIRDTGVGISEEQQQHLFQAFTQGDGNITREYGGTGLGLIISQRLVNAMGGQGIHLDSQEGDGSCFSFTLPLRACTSDEVKQLENTKNNESDGLQPLQGRVLLVEDNAINQEVAQMQLHQLGLSVTLAENGQEALEALNDHSFDLVLMDIQMPLMDGYEATRQIRQQGLQLPVIALTAAAMAEDQQLALESGMNDHLSKPIDPQQLYQVLSQWLPKSAQPIKSDEANQSSSVGMSNVQEEPTAPKLMDVNQGLSLLGGNQTLYKKLVQQFVEQIHLEFSLLVQKMSDLESGNRSQNYEEAQKLAHALKGVSGNLALTRLSLIATDLDRQLKVKQPPTPELIEAFKNCLDQTSNAIQEWVNHQNVSTNNEKLNEHLPTKQMISSLQSLKSAISNNQFIDEVELSAISVHLPNPCQAEWQELVAAVEEFNFDRANQLIDSVLKQLLGKTNL